VQGEWKSIWMIDQSNGEREVRISGSYRLSDMNDSVIPPRPNRSAARTAAGFASPEVLPAALQVHVVAPTCGIQRAARDGWSRPRGSIGTAAPSPRGA
jgi:hypothetical protein